MTRTMINQVPDHPTPGPDQLGLLDPLLGEWVAEGESPVGPYLCRRRFFRTLGGTHVQLQTHWDYVSDPFEEMTLFAADEVHGLQYWTFSSNGEQSVGKLSSAGGSSEPALVFESLTPAGRIRMSYRPVSTAGVVVFVIDSKTRTGWSRLLEHHYRSVRRNGGQPSSA